MTSDVSKLDNSSILPNGRSNTESNNPISQMVRGFFTTITGWVTMDHGELLTNVVPKTISDLDGWLWRYVKYEDDIYGGKRCLFMFKPDDETDSKLKEMYPAIEPQIFQIPPFSPGIDMEKFGYSFKVSGDYPNQIGYMWLPNQKAIEARYKQLQKENPDLQDLKIISIDGTATHMEFFRAFLAYDVLLSSGREFVHDHFFHVYRTLSMMLSDPKDYYRAKELLRAKFRPIYEKMKSLEVEMEKGNSPIHKEELSKLQTALGGVIDVLWALDSSLSMKRYASMTFDALFRVVWVDDREFGGFWKKTFKEDFKVEKIAPLLRKVMRDHVYQ